MRLPKFFTPHTVQLEPYLGEGANGESWGPVVDQPDVFVEDVTEKVVDDTGAEVVSRGRVTFNIDDAPLMGSYVTVWSGTVHERRSRIFKLALNDHPAWPGFAIGYLR